MTKLETITKQLTQESLDSLFRDYQTNIGNIDGKFVRIGTGDTSIILIAPRVACDPFLDLGAGEPEHAWIVQAALASPDTDLQVATKAANEADPKTSLEQKLSSNWSVYDAGRFIYQPGPNGYLIINSLSALFGEADRDGRRATIALAASKMNPDIEVRS